MISRPRPAIEHFRQAGPVFRAAERRPRGRDQRSGEFMSHGHLRALSTPGPASRSGLAG